MNTSWRTWRASFYVLLLGVLVACGSETAPTVTLTASSETITIGESSELSWVLSGDEPITLSLSPDIGVELTSPITVSPTETTTYTLTASNDAGSSSASVTIVVESAPVVNAPSVSLSASSETITLGQSSELSWMVSGDEPISLSISPDLGIDDLTSPVTVSPIETTTYILTASNDAGSTSASVTIVVESAPTISLSASSENLTMGQSSELSWIVSGSDPISLSISPDLGINDLTSPLTVSPTETTTYTLTATNDVGSSSASITITVENNRVGENYELTDEAVVLSSEELDITLISQDDSTMTLQGDIPDIEIGDVIISLLGDGALRRVLGISNENGNFILTTEQASLTDAFVHLDFSLDDATFVPVSNPEVDIPGITLSFDNSTTLETASLLPELISLNLKYGNVTFGGGISPTSCISIDGEVDFDMNPDFDINVELLPGDTSPTVTFYAALEPTLSASLQVDAKGVGRLEAAIGDEVLIGRWVTPGIPILISAYFTVGARDQGTYAGSFSTDFSASVGGSAIVSRDIAGNFNLNTEIPPVSASGNASGVLGRVVN